MKRLFFFILSLLSLSCEAQQIRATAWTTTTDPATARAGLNAVATSLVIGTTAPLTGGGALTANLTLSIPQADATHDGYLLHTDWSTFNGKQGTNTATGILTGNGGSTITGRTITAGSSKISVANGSGATANPAIDLGTVTIANLSDGTNVDTLNGNQTITGNKVLTGTISGSGATNLIRTVYLPGANVTLTTNVNGTVTVSSSGGSSAIVLTNTSFVTTSGDDSTAIRARLDKPFATLSAAKTNSFYGDCVQVFPATYTVSTNLATNYLNWYFFPGSTITPAEVSPPPSGLGDADFAILFNDAGLTAGTTNIIRGDADILFASADSIGSDSLIILTNSASTFDANFKNITLTYELEGDLTPGTVIASNDLFRLHAENVNITPISPGNLMDSFMLVNAATAKIEIESYTGGTLGLFQNGNHSISLGDANCFNGNLFDFIDSGTSKDITHIDGHNLSADGILFSFTGLNVKHTYWIEGDVFHSTNSYVGYWNPDGGSFQGKSYFRNVGKLWGSGMTGMAGSSIFWMAAGTNWAGGNKMTCDGNGGFVDLEGSTAVCELSFQQYEDSAGKMTNGFLNNGGQLILHGGREVSVSTNSSLLQHNSGTTYAENMLFDNSNSTNPPIQVGGAGLTLKNCTILSSSGIPGISNPTTNNINVNVDGTLTMAYPAATNVVFTNGNIVIISQTNFVISSLAAASEISLTSGTASNVTSISLTRGKWEVSGSIAFDAGGATTITSEIGGYNTTSGTLPAVDSGQIIQLAESLTGGVNTIVALPTMRLDILNTTTIYLVAKSSFAVSTMKSYGIIRARRISE